jgi:long-chain acyl-CoA synthetase
VNLATIIDGHPHDRVAVVSQGHPLTYGELRTQVDALRTRLAGRGVREGDRVVLLCGNGVPFVVTYLATVGLGAVAVPLNPSSPGPEIAGELAVVQPSAAVVDPVARTAWHSLDPALVDAIANVIATEGHDLGGALTLEELVRSPGTGDVVPIADVEASALAALLFTSGTAGSPRAAMLTHGNLRSNIEQSLASPDRLVASDVVLGVLPLHHIFGLNVVLGLTLAVGASVVLVQRFDPTSALDTIVDRGVTVVPGAPPMWLAWAQFGDTPGPALRRLRLALSGASKLPTEAMATLRERFGLVLREGYGLTEASPVVTTSTGIEPRPGSVGKVLPGVEVRLVDPDGAPVLAGDPGEIWVRGPNVFAGYWNDPDATARVLTEDGWLRTGDVAVADDDGYLYIVDRAKDLIIVSGFNVYPAEVEEVIDEIDGVREAAVVGVDHPHSGEAVKAFVVTEPGVHLDEDTVIARCADQLARYKCPTKVMFVEALPRNVGGKVLRRALR